MFPKTFSGPETGAPVEYPPSQWVESSRRRRFELHCINILHIVYVEYFVMYICIYVYSLKRNYMGFDPQWMRYVGDRLKSGSSPNFFDKNVHGIEEGLNVLMI